MTLTSAADLRSRSSLCCRVLTGSRPHCSYLKSQHCWHCPQRCFVYFRLTVCPLRSSKVGRQRCFCRLLRVRSPGSLDWTCDSPSWVYQIDSHCLNQLKLQKVVLQKARARQAHHLGRPSPPSPFSQESALNVDYLSFHCHPVVEYSCLGPFMKNSWECSNAYPNCQ